MKAFGLFLGMAIAVQAEDVKWPRLAGIVHLKGSNQPAAILVLNPPTSLPKVRTAPGPKYASILHAREADMGLGYEVLSIDAARGTVKLRATKSSETTELTLTALPKGEKYAVHLERAPLRAAVDCYQTLSGRTVIYSPKLPISEIDVHIAANQEKTAMIASLTKALEAHETFMIDRGDKYAFAVPDPHRALVELLPEPPGSDGKDIIPPGLIKFSDADVLLVIDFYSDLSGRTVLRPNHFPRSPVTLRTETALSRGEAIWLVEAALRLGGLTTVREGEKFVFVTPPERAKDLPKFDPGRKIAGEPGVMKFVEIDLEMLLEAYAGLTRLKPAGLEPKTPPAKISLRSHGPLSPAEAAFALEAVAMLNNLAFRVAGKEVKLSPLAAKGPKIL